MSEFLKLINDPFLRLRETMIDVRASLSRPGCFALAIAGTEVSDLPGISAAGADGPARRKTPAVDAEALVRGYPISCETLPRSPEGIVSPVVITRAMMELLGCGVEIFDCGTFHQPHVPFVPVGNQPARSPSTGSALEAGTCEMLYEAGQQHGERLSSSCEWLVIAECVPGGTTTALGVLSALGYPAAELVSSSMSSIDNLRRGRLIEAGLSKANLDSRSIAGMPLQAVAAVGDPMQPFACGLLIAAARRIPVILSGGSQMLAVYALAKAMHPQLSHRRICVVTTKWVAFDRAANVCRLAQLVGAPFIASCPDFLASRHQGLQAYEQGNVKEGAGMGSSLALAHLAGFDHRCIVDAIDAQYDRMVLSQAVPLVTAPSASQSVTRGVWSD